MVSNIEIYDHVMKVINSCETPEQYQNAERWFLKYISPRLSDCIEYWAAIDAALLDKQFELHDRVNCVSRIV